MSEYRNLPLYRGRPAAILGGGPSLPGDVTQLGDLDDWLLISVNYHAFYLPETAGRVSYMVYNDDPTSDPELAEAVEYCRRNFIGRVSPHQTSDILFDEPVWTGFTSSCTAAWFALYMGCNPVVLCGHDLYQGDAKYFHPCEKDVPAFHLPLADHVRPWVEEGRNLLPNVGQLRAVSGPLVSVFGQYQP